MSVSEIAKIAPIVFQEAFAGDDIAMKIIDRAAEGLGNLLAAVLKKIDTPHAKTYLIGGVFKSQHSEKFIQKMLASPAMSTLKLDKQSLTINLAAENLATLAVQKLKKKYDPRLCFLDNLPITKAESYASFAKKCKLNKLSTEQAHPLTTQLSQVFSQSLPQAPLSCSML